MHLTNSPQTLFSLGEELVEVVAVDIKEEEEKLVVEQDATLADIISIAGAMVGADITVETAEIKGRVIKMTQLLNIK